MSVRFSVKHLVVLLIIFFAVPLYAQTADDSSSSSPQDFFIAPLAEVLGYSQKGPAFGGGFALGAGSGVAIGARFLYAIDTESIHTMEIAAFIRFYLLGADACTGPFAQLIAGAAIFNYEHTASPPAKAGALSVGIVAGWRFTLGERWYVEPAIRVGYPYIAGAGASFAYRF